MPSNLMAIEFFERFASWLPSSYAREYGYSSNLTQLRFAASIARAPGRVHQEMRCSRLIATRRSGAPILNQLIEDELARCFAAGILSRAEIVHIWIGAIPVAWPAANLAANGTASLSSRPQKSFASG